ncbi:uncharacterized protein LOC124436662 [Xenia sp. Carnegie-2017]|uniref:uncharacterized protein LOC124436662 n=1 Tax=Xenia sp. Carnegie-2017 TaxID=2897299 RepID=UPI001F03CB98|nr:uncharacterized protein LOC124436662 [Xenia sp. Carnegie-2017]
MNLTAENAKESPTFTTVFGTIQLSSRYSVEQNIVTTFMVILSFIGILANVTLLFVIIKDPFKQLRTITAILLAFNSITNLGLICALFVESLWQFSNEELPPELFLHANVSSLFLCTLGNFLHIINTYGAIVIPVRYRIVAPKIRRYLVQSLALAALGTFVVIVIPVCVLPEGKQQDFSKVIMTVLGVLLVLLSIIFAILYHKIFRSLYARNNNLTFALRRRHSVYREHSRDYRNQRMVMTLLIHVVFFILTTLPASVLAIIFLNKKMSDAFSLATLFSLPIFSSPFVFLPILWLFRLKNYKRAMVKIIYFWKGRHPEAETQQNTNPQTMMTSLQPPL